MLFGRKIYAISIFKRREVQRETYIVCMLNRINIFFFFFSRGKVTKCRVIQSLRMTGMVSTIPMLMSFDR